MPVARGIKAGRSSKSRVDGDGVPGDTPIFPRGSVADAAPSATKIPRSRQDSPPASTWIPPALARDFRHRRGTIFTDSGTPRGALSERKWRHGTRDGQKTFV